MKRLTPATVTMLMFGVVGCLVVAYVAKGLLAVDAKPPLEMRNLPMALGEIAPGTVITEEHIGSGPFPADRLERDMLLANRVIVGRVAKTEIPAASPIRAGQLYQPGEMPALDVAQGMRAVSVEVGESVHMVEGLIKPGQFVDVHFTVTSAGNDDNLQGGLTMRLFKGVRVVSINRNLAQGRVERGSNRVTLELSEEQANMLILAREKGQITLSYTPEGRGDGGMAVSSDERATLDQILGLSVKPPVQTEIFRGTGRSVLTWRDGRLINADGPATAPARTAPAQLPTPTPPVATPPASTPTYTPQPVSSPTTAMNFPLH